MIAIAFSSTLKDYIPNAMVVYVIADKMVIGQKSIKHTIFKNIDTIVTMYRRMKRSRYKGRTNISQNAHGLMGHRDTF
jgi:hypothetical protein